MSNSRLSTVLDDGLIVLPDGQISVMRPAADYDLSALPRERVQISTGSYPEFAAFAAAGYVTTPRPERAQVAIVVVPRAKALARALVAEAAKWADLIIVDGQKTDGIDSIFKECRKRLGDLPSITKGHGRIFWFAPKDVFSDWVVGAPAPGAHGFVTTAGVFSDGAIDAGSALLAAALPQKLPAKIADLGAGWGYLSQEILKHEGVQSVALVEAEALALDCARLNITDPRAEFHWADANHFKPAGSLDAVIMNPPFHAGRAADPAVGRGFINAAAAILASHGKLWMVANRHLPYEAALREKFRNVEELPGSGGFKIFHATRPLRK